MDKPSEPIVFFKSSSAWSGPNDNIVIPRNSKKTDWEVELAVVIGKKAKYVSYLSNFKRVMNKALALSMP